jgi:hypothetical protein
VYISKEGLGKQDLEKWERMVLRCAIPVEIATVSAKKGRSSRKISGFCIYCKFGKFHTTVLKLCRIIH